MTTTTKRADREMVTTDHWKPVEAMELTRIEGGLFGISWDDVKGPLGDVAHWVYKRL